MQIEFVKVTAEKLIDTHFGFFRHTLCSPYCILEVILKKPFQKAQGV